MVWLERKKLGNRLIYVSEQGVSARLARVYVGALVD